VTCASSSRPARRSSSRRSSSFLAIRDHLKERKIPYQAIVAFSGEHEYGGTKVTEATLNGFPSNDISDRIQGTRIGSSSAPTKTYYLYSFLDEIQAAGFRHSCFDATSATVSSR
jgi:hypothetical protein